MMMTVKEVAEYLQFHQTTIYRLVRSRRIPYMKVGSRVRFNKASIELWLTNKLLARRLNDE